LLIFPQVQDAVPEPVLGVIILYYIIESPFFNRLSSRGYILLSRNDDHPYIGIVLPIFFRILRPIAIRQGIVPSVTTSGFSWSWAKNSRGDSESFDFVFRIEREIMMEHTAVPDVIFDDKNF